MRVSAGDVRGNALAAKDLIQKNDVIRVEKYKRVDKHKTRQ